jgi:hypothetical protein
MAEPAAVNPGWRKSSYSNSNGGACIEVGALPWRKSSYSNGGGDNCVEVGTWRKSSYSNGNGGQCVEAGHASGAILIRDTTQHAAGPVLRVSAETWHAFTTAVRASTVIR